MSKWRPWNDVINRKKELAKHKIFEYEEINLDFCLGIDLETSIPGVEWDIEGKYAARICTEGLTPKQLVEFGLFVANIPDSWDRKAYVTEYVENGKNYIEVGVYPD